MVRAGLDERVVLDQPASGNAQRHQGSRDIHTRHGTRLSWLPCGGRIRGWCVAAGVGWMVAVARVDDCGFAGARRHRGLVDALVRQAVRHQRCVRRRLPRVDRRCRPLARHLDGAFPPRCRHGVRTPSDMAAEPALVDVAYRRLRAPGRRGAGTARAEQRHADDRRTDRGFCRRHPRADPAGRRGRGPVGADRVAGAPTVAGAAGGGGADSLAEAGRAIRDRSCGRPRDQRDGEAQSRGLESHRTIRPVVGGAGLQRRVPQRRAPLGPDQLRGARRGGLPRFGGSRIRRLLRRRAGRCGRAPRTGLAVDHYASGRARCRRAEVGNSRPDLARRPGPSLYATASRRQHPAPPDQRLEHRLPLLTALLATLVPTT